MPISDLLASITGEKPATSPTTITRPSPGIPKRKADDELRGTTAKAPRTELPVNGSARPNGGISKPVSRPLDRPGSTTANKPSPTAARPSPRLSNPLVRPSGVTTTSGARPASTSSGKPLPTRPIVNRPVTADTGPKPEPKKRSFQEIMARAKANSAVRESFGKIQHKTIEKGLTMKERKEQKAEESRQSKKGVRPQPQSRYGTAATSRVGSTSANPRNPPPSKSATIRGKAGVSPVGEEKKVKKAALATTGYTGTARPPPGAKPSKAGAAALPERAAPRVGARYGGALSGRKRYDDYDEELDDFIEYDDEEEVDPRSCPRYGYQDEEDESDMEAGLTDIDEEERRAEMVARKEDQEQEALEMRLKREKERKRLLASKGGR